MLQMSFGQTAIEYEGQSASICQTVLGASVP
jgi:hypothetical protein